MNRLATITLILAALGASSAAYAQRPYEVPGAENEEPRYVGVDKAAYGAGVSPMTSAVNGSVGVLYYDSARTRPICVGFDSIVHTVAGPAAVTSFAFSLTSSVALGTPATEQQCNISDPNAVNGVLFDRGPCWTLAAGREAWRTPDYRILSRRVGARTGLCSVAMPSTAAVGTWDDGLGPRPFCRVDQDCVDAVGSGVCVAAGACVGAACNSATDRSARGCAFLLARAVSADIASVEIHR